MTVTSKAQRAVALSGIGLASCLGCDVKSWWKALLAGEMPDVPDPNGESSARYATVPGTPGRAILRQRRHSRILSRPFELALAAACAAATDACLPDLPEDQHGRVAIVLGIGDVDIESEELLNAIRHIRETRSAEEVTRVTGVEPLRRLKHLSNIGACLIAMELGIEGQTTTLVGGNQQGLTAIVLGYKLIQDNICDVVLCGGSDVPSMFFETTSPSSRCRPFDTGRDGTLLAEGAAVVVLESAELRPDRDRLPYATVSGGVLFGPGTTSSVRELTALVSTPAQSPIDVVLAHGDGTVESDRFEIEMLHRVMSATSATPLVSSVKAQIGHTLTASGAFNAIAGALTLTDGVIPGIPTLRDPDSEHTELRFVMGTGTGAADVRRLLVNALDRSGSGASLLLEKIASS